MHPPQELIVVDLVLDEGQPAMVTRRVSRRVLAVQRALGRLKRTARTCAELQDLLARLDALRPHDSTHTGAGD